MRIIRGHMKEGFLTNKEAWFVLHKIDSTELWSPQTIMYLPSPWKHSPMQQRRFWQQRPLKVLQLVNAKARNKGNTVTLLPTQVVYSSRAKGPK